MSIERGLGSPPTNGGTDEQSKPAKVADRATSAAGEVATTAKSGAQDVAGEAKAQAKVVAGEAKRQVGNVVDQTRQQLSQQAGERTSQAAGALHTLSEQVSALADGRPADAGPLTGYLDDVRERVSAIASRLDEGGPQGLIDDVTDLARRRPVVFLAAAVGAGFVVGRLARAGRAAQQDESATPMLSSVAPVAPLGELQPPLAAPTAPFVASVPV